jgi:putative intracellular protease/amidase
MTTANKGKIGVLIEDHFDPFEFRRFNEYFPQQGYEVEYISYLWGNKELKFGSNAEDNIVKEYVTVTTDVNDVNPGDYKAIVCIGAYAMDRLRYEEKVKKGQKNHAPAVVFISKAMQEPDVKVCAICHGLWLISVTDLLKGRQVTCAHNLISDVENAGADIIYEEDRTADIVIDRNLITGRHPGMVDLFVETIVKEIAKKQPVLS